MVEGRTIHLLGAVRAVQDDEELVLAGAQARRVLVLLALERDRPVTADELAQILWPDGPGRHWEGALRGVISKVRVFLATLGPAPPTIENIGRTYRFVPSRDVDVDVEVAARLVVEAEAHMAADRPTEADRAATRAVALLSAPLLEGEPGEWLDGRRAELLVLRHRSERVASVAASSLGRHDQAVDLATSARADDPCDEEGQRALMRAHLAGGDRRAALGAYAECRRALADALGVAPSPETEDLHLQLLADASTPRPSRSGLAMRTERPFVGRQRELMVLTRAWEQALAGRRQVVLVHGEPGVGKTRVALEVARRVVPPRLLYGRASAEEAAPFEPFAEALTRHVDLLDDDDLGALVHPFDRALSRVVPTIGTRRGTSAVPQIEGDDRPRTFEAVRAVIDRVAVAPTILVLDDLHWADGSTLLLLRHVLRTLEHAHLLVIVTYRDDGDPTEAWSEAVTELHRLDGCHTLPVEGLGGAEIVEMLRAGRIEQADQLGPALAERTGGNPFYLTQVLSATEDPGSFDPFRVPETVSNLVRHRVATLSAGARSVLAVGAVLGTGMSIDTLEHAVADGGGHLEAIDELLERRLLLEVEAGRYSFAHAIARDAVYGQLSRTRRRRLHLDVARAVAATGGGDPESAAAEAYHYRMADDPAHAVDLVDATVRAADHAMEVLAYEQAADLYGQAVGAITRFAVDEPRVAALHVGLGAARRRLGDFAGARSALAVAIDLARAPGQEAVFAEAVLELVAKAGRGVAVDLPDADRADLLQEAVDRLDHEPTAAVGDDPARPDLLVTLLAELALALLLTEQSDRRRAVAERAVGLARGDRRVELAARAVVAQRLLKMHPVRAAERLADTDAIVGSTCSRVSAEQLARMHMWRIADCFELGDRDGVDRELAALTARADELGQPYWRWQAATWQALHTFVGGDPARAEAEAVAALQLLAAVEHPEAVLAYGIQLIGFRLQEGRGAEVVGLLRDVVAANPHVPAMRCGLTFALAQAGERREAAQQLADLADEDLAAIPQDANWSVAVTCLAETACELGDADLAARLIPLIRPCRQHFVVVTGFGGGGACWGPFSGVLASLEACIGDEPSARRDYDHALAALERFRAPVLARRIAETRDERLGRAFDATSVLQPISGTRA